MFSVFQSVDYFFFIKPLGRTSFCLTRCIDSTSSLAAFFGMFFETSPKSALTTVFFSVAFFYRPRLQKPVGFAGLVRTFPQTQQGASILYAWDGSLFYGGRLAKPRQKDFCCVSQSPRGKGGYRKSAFRKLSYSPGSSPSFTKAQLSSQPFSYFLDWIV